MKITRIAAVASCLPLLLGAAACSGGDGASDSTPITIGADLELTGTYAAIGITYERALDLKISQINAAGGVHGRPLRLTALDNRSDPTVAVTNINQLATDPSVATVVTGACSLCLIGVYKTLDDKQMPTIALAPATEVASPVTDRSYIFKIGPNAEDNAALLANELRVDGAQRVALLTTSDLDGTDSGTAITAQLKGKIELVSRQTFKDTDTDLSQPVQDALNSDPDTLVVSAFPSQADAVAHAAHTAGFVGKIYFDSTAAGDLFLTGVTKSGAQDVRMIAPQTMVIDDVIATSPAKTDRKNWFAAYTSKYGAFSGFSTYAADAVQMVANTVASTGGTDHAKLRVAMESLQFEGLSGPLQFTPDNHSGLMPQALTILVVRSGRWRLLA